MITKDVSNIPNGYHLIYRPYITLRNGKKLYAWQAGKKAFPLIVPIKAQ
jgi:hypothetical protein